jgi:hypothetical protein
VDTLPMCDLVKRSGPFASVYLPPTMPARAWPTLRRELVGQHIAPATLDVLDRVVTVAPNDGLVGRALISAADQVLVDDRPRWSPPKPVARVSDLPYLLPLLLPQTVHQGQPVTTVVATDPGRAMFDEFVFQSSRPGGPTVDGLEQCTEHLRQDNVDALVVAPDQLGEKEVWVAGALPTVFASSDPPRDLGVRITSMRADEALPAAALAIGAAVVVTSDPLPLTDGVGALLRTAPWDR